MSSSPLPSRRALGRALLGVALLACGPAVLSVGCRTVKKEWDVPAGPAFQPKNHTGVAVLPAAVRRTAVLPLHADSWPAAHVAPIENALRAELAKFERFELVSVARTEMREQFSSETLLSSAALPADMLERLRASHGADAVLFLDLTHYSPYQPIAIGVRGKLVSTVDGRVLWSFDAVFDAAQPSVAVAAREYHQAQGRLAPPLDNSSGIMQSPSRFAKYVAHAMFGTLPPRQTR